MLDKRFMRMAWTCHGRFMDGAAGDGARTRNFNVGKVTVLFCIQALGITASRCLSTRIFERFHTPIDSHHAPI
jgi:hypothetical protein